MRVEILRSLESKVQPLCRVIDAELNGVVKGKDRKNGFAILLFRFDGDEATYGSNAERADMVKALRECADRLEARADSPPGFGKPAAGAG
jgi:hypothetical protein